MPCYRVVSFLCSIAATLLTPHVLAYPTLSPSSGMGEIPVLGVDTQYCTELIKVSSHKIFLSEGEQIDSDFCNTSSIGLPVTPPTENLLQQNENSPSSATPLVTDYPCTAQFDGKVLSIPCIKIKGLDVIYKADLSVISYTPMILFNVTNVAEVSDPTIGKITKPAAVESIEVRVLESFPVQANVVIRGYLRNGCESLETQTPKLFHVSEDDVFRIQLNVYATAADNVSCLAVITPFEQTLRLDVMGLKAGIYTVEVNGLVSLFELSKDNIIKP